MKNIHVVATDKPSRLYLFEERLILGDLVTVVFKNSGAVNQNIYITSDEEIKEGDWYYDDFIKQIIIADNRPIGNDCKKIILTTDQDLIKDGVQSIDDEFLEWFVKNLSCEYVKVEDYGNLYNFRYLILIPKEESKQETLEEAKAHTWIDFAKTNKDVDMYSFVIGFDKGYKLAQHQCYSEEKVYSIMRMCLGMKESGKTDIEIKEMFEQKFKKK